MAELNYLRIAQILGGTLTDAQQPTFGVFGAASVSAERFRLVASPHNQPPAIAPSQFPLIAAAFEEVRHGFEPDRVLVDPILSKRFIAACRQRGVRAPEVLINTRLQALRKSSAYRIKLKPTTKPAGLEPEPFFYGAELGFVQLSYRKRVSVDNIITDPKVGDEFVSLCRQIEPHGRPMDFKWALLRLRKMRSFSPKKIRKLLAVEAGAVEEKLHLVGTLDRISMTDVPADKGIFSFMQLNTSAKYLYIGATERTLREAFKPFQTAHPFMAMAGPFWQPTLGDIALHVGVVRTRVLGASPRDLSLRLIEERRPLFNMPVHLG
ncbi:MAG TPA: hypothetical protein VFC78_06165 [Tepidisphaeraceae bacterium]|nr:hypothetical protein [Tepidisphaeraceae bacterium]